MKEVIRNLPKFITAYLKSENGIRTLKRESYRDAKTGEAVWRSPAMGFAFAKALGANLATSQGALELTPKQTKNTQRKDKISVFMDSEGKKQNVPDMMKRKR